MGQRDEDEPEIPEERLEVTRDDEGEGIDRGLEPNEDGTLPVGG